MAVRDENTGANASNQERPFPFSMMAMCMNMAATMSAHAMRTAREGMNACAGMMGARSGPEADSEKTDEKRA